MPTYRGLGNPLPTTSLDLLIGRVLTAVHESAAQTDAVFDLAMPGRTLQRMRLELPAFAMALAIDISNAATIRARLSRRPEGHLTLEVNHMHLQRRHVVEIEPTTPANDRDHDSQPARNPAARNALYAALQLALGGEGRYELRLRVQAQAQGDLLAEGWASSPDQFIDLRELIDGAHVAKSDAAPEEMPHAPGHVVPIAAWIANFVSKADERPDN